MEEAFPETDSKKGLGSLDHGGARRLMVGAKTWPDLGQARQRDVDKTLRATSSTKY